MSHYDDLREKDVQTPKRPAVKKAKKKVNKGGRPKIAIDYKKLDTMCAMQCTGEECASILDVSYEHLNNQLKKDGNGGFLDYFKQKSANGKMSLRRKQFEVANNGNPTMLIWLGKQWLGQLEKPESADDDTGESMTINFNVSEPIKDVKVTRGE